jgi:adenosylhomocysteine nucleosidase
MTRHEVRFSVLFSANAEWESVKRVFPGIASKPSPYGEYFFAEVTGYRVIFFQGGWGKVAAAASTQYVIDLFKPTYLINLGTCGGVEGRINRLDVVAVERAVMYDIHEAMGDSSEAIAHYTTDLDIPRTLLRSIRRVTMYSADRDLTPCQLRELERRCRPRVADWESGAIAWVAKRNRTRVLILRGVTDLVNLDKAEAEGNMQFFRESTEQVMQNLIRDLPEYMSALLNS